MNKVWLTGFALITLTLSAFARPINPSAQALDEGASGLANRSYSCVAVDSLGHRFTGSSFIPGQARRAALLICENSRHEPRERGCRIESCGLAGEEEDFLRP